jgi:hypothetical protein
MTPPTILTEARAVLQRASYRVRAVSDAVVRINGDERQLRRAEERFRGAGWQIERRGWWVEASPLDLPPSQSYTLWFFEVVGSPEDGGHYLIPNETLNGSILDAMRRTDSKFLNGESPGGPFDNASLRAFFLLEAAAGHFHEDTPEEARKPRGGWANRFRSYRAPDWAVTFGAVRITARYHSGKYL